MSDLFTSDAACNAVAKRTVREVAKHNLAPVDAVGELAAPIATELRQRGKLPRNALPELFRNFLRRLADTPNIIDIEVGAFRTADLSVNESRMVRFVMVISEFAGWLHCVTCEAKLSRRDLRLRFAGTEFRVSEHVLTRYMRREQKDLRHFFSGVTETLRAACLIGPATLLSDSSATAVPFRDGLLLGDTHFIAEENFPKRYPVEICYDRNDGRRVVGELDLLVRGRVPLIEMRTFVDGQSLSPRKERLRDILLDWRRKHREGIDTFSSAMLFGSAPVRPNADQKAMRQQSVEAIYAARDVVLSEAWQDYTAHRQAEERG